MLERATKSSSGPAAHAGVVSQVARTHAIRSDQTANERGEIPIASTPLPSQLGKHLQLAICGRGTMSTRAIQRLKSAPRAYTFGAHTPTVRNYFPSSRPLAFRLPLSVSGLPAG